MRTFDSEDLCFKCPCAKCQADPSSRGITRLVAIKLNLMQKQLYSEEMEVDLVPTSGRRCSMHNAMVGGAPDSMHLDGLAVDLKTTSPELTYRIVDAAIVWNVPFIEVSPHHVHIDLREIPRPCLIIGPG